MVTAGSIQERASILDREGSKMLARKDWLGIIR